MGVFMELMEDAISLEKRLFEKASKNNVPLYGILELLPLCNMNCDMCYVRMDAEEMKSKGRLRTFDEWVPVIKEMKATGMLFVLLTGGEPLLYKDFKKLYIELLNQGMVVSINTNGTLIDDDWADFFEEYRPRRINITLYGGSDDTYENLCHYKGGFNKTIDGIKRLLDRGIEVKLNGSLAKKNMKEWDKILDIGDMLGVPVRMDTYMYPVTRERSCSYNDQSRMTPKEAGELRVKVLKREMEREKGEEFFKQAVEYNLCKALCVPEGEEVPAGMKCKAGKCSFVINWQGNMIPCVVLNQLSIPVFETGFAKAWNMIVEGTKQIFTSAKCGKCRYREFCNTCAAAALAETGSYDGVPEYICEYTMESIKSFLKIREE